MKDRQFGAAHDCGVHAKHCIERRGTRRMVKELLQRRLKTRRLVMRIMASSAAVGTVATMATLAEYATLS
jgi:hypothetical protein